MNEKPNDPLYEHFVKNINPKCEIVDFVVIEHEKHSFNSPRKEVEVEIKDKESGTTQTYRYNYNLLLKQIDEIKKEPKSLIIAP